MNDRILSTRRALVTVGIGVLVGVALTLTGTPSLGPLAAWCTAGLIALVQVWHKCWRQDADGTDREEDRREDDVGGHRVHQLRSLVPSPRSRPSRSRASSTPRRAPCCVPVWGPMR